MDCFLYEDDNVEELVEQRKLARNYCIDCKSWDIKLVINRDSQPSYSYNVRHSGLSLSFLILSQFLSLNSCSLKWFLSLKSRMGSFKIVNQSFSIFSLRFRVVDIGSRFGSVCAAANLFRLFYFHSSSR